MPDYDLRKRIVKAIKDSGWYAEFNGANNREVYISKLHTDEDFGFEINFGDEYELIRKINDYVKGFNTINTSLCQLAQAVNLATDC